MGSRDDTQAAASVLAEDLVAVRIPVLERGDEARGGGLWEADVGRLLGRQGALVVAVCHSSNIELGRGERRAVCVGIDTHTRRN